MTRILMTADAVGGVWTYACELASALAAAGVSTTIATMGPIPSEDQMATAAGIPGVEIVTSRYRLEWMDDPWADIERAGRWLLDVESRIQPWLVHLNGYVHAALPFARPVLAVGHSCVQSWSDTTGGRIDPGWLSRYRAAVRAGLRAADWVVAPTAAMLRVLQQQYGPLPRASVVPNGRSAATFQPLPKEPFVFTAGRLWDRAKNVGAVLDIVPRVPWPVVVAGFETVAAAAPARGRATHVQAAPATLVHLGRLSEPEIAAWLGRASIYAHPARYEPFGLLPLEAALCGCALVLGDIESLRDTWDGAAVFVPPDDHDALAHAIHRLASSPTFLRICGRKAHERAQHYTPERMAGSYLRLYEHIAGGARGTAVHRGSARRDGSREALRCAS